jgi:long-chain fatty acid transport protein
MRNARTLALPAALALAGLTSLPAQATNGMNMEGYGPISTGMGGASQAIDHGTAALAQNPATLALMGEGSRLDLALGVLGPNVRSSVPGLGEKSSATSFTMPALGYVRRSGAFTYGVGVFAQGGMGTEYGGNSFLAMGSGEPVRSELGVGRVLLPLAWQATPELALGATLDFMWAGLDMRMAASGAQLGQLVTGAAGNLGSALPGLASAPWARVDFSNNSDFSGAASSTGWAAKLGLVYQAAPGVTLGASYQLKSALKDMKTTANGASLSGCMGASEGGQGVRARPQALSCTGQLFQDSGRITVVDFQWPAMLALGGAWQATPALLVAADLKQIYWSSVMKDFRLRYDSAGMGGSVSFALPQNWKNQTVLNLGLAWAMNAELTLRAGLNLASNPIPDALVHPLFPATVEKHLTLGAGYRLSPASELNGALTVAPKTTVTNGLGVTISHSQTNVQLMYTHRF